MALGLEIFPYGRQGLIYIIVQGLFNIIVHISVAADDMVMQEAIPPAVYEIVSPAAIFF